MSSDDGHMSDYDFVDIQESGYSSDDTDTTVTSSLAPPQGWSTLSLSDAGAAKAGSASAAAAAAAGAARRKFISAVPNDAAAAALPRATGVEVSKQLECSVCRRLLRDCVECPTCHSLFCRDHLRIEATGTSPCPCDPCRPAAAPVKTADRAPFSTAAAATVVSADSTAPATTTMTPSLQVHQHPASAFLPNIPVQRMADAVPSSCEGCGMSMTWGELGLHACDQQLVPCDGCGWIGKRHERDLHASTCAGREIVSRARHEALEARAELGLARRDAEEAERRASSAEMRASELEARLLAAERKLLQRDEEAEALRAAAAEHAKKEDELQRLLREEQEKAKAAAEKAAADGARKAQQLARRRTTAAAAAPTGKTTAAAVAAPPGATAPLGFAAMLNRAGFAPAAAEPAAPAAATAAATQTAAPATATRASGRSGSTTKGALHAAVQMARGGSPTGRGIMTDTASQAPVPSVEACLKPYLDRPNSLLEKKVVVFWPRQGRWYVGRPTSYKEATKEHRVEYDDGDMRDHVLAHRSWGLLG